MAIRIVPGNSGISGYPRIYGCPGGGCDTVFIERWHTEIRDSIVETHDTLEVMTRDSIEVPVEVPIEVEKPLPKWVKKSIAALIIENIIIAAVIVIRLRTRKTLRRLTR